MSVCYLLCVVAFLLRYVAACTQTEADGHVTLVSLLKVTEQEQLRFSIFLTFNFHTCDVHLFGTWPVSSRYYMWTRLVSAWTLNTAS